MTIRTITTVVIVATIAILIGYDVWAIATGGVEGTISDVIQVAAFKAPAIPFAAGFLCGHFFFGRRDEK